MALHPSDPIPPAPLEKPPRDDRDPNTPLLPREKRRRTKVMLSTAIRRLEKALGGRQRIAHAIMFADEVTASEKQVAEALADPRNARKSMWEIMRYVDPTLSFSKVLKLFARGKTAEEYAKTLNEIQSGLPRVAEYLMKTSVPYTVECPSCRGRKMVPEGGFVKCEDCSGAGCRQCRGQGQFRALVPCLECKGHGRILKEPDTERMKLALQAGGIIGTGGNAVNITNIQQTQRIEATFVQTSTNFRSATDKLLWAKPQQALAEGAQEAELVEAAPVRDEVGA